MDATILDLLKIFIPSTVALIGVIFAWRASTRAKESVDVAKVAVDVTTELGLRLDGRLEELKKLWQSEANLQGRIDERVDSETRRLAERAEAKEDRAEGALQQATPNTVIPVETRTEAKETSSDSSS